MQSWLRSDVREGDASQSEPSPPVRIASCTARRRDEIFPRNEGGPKSLSSTMTPLDAALAEPPPLAEVTPKLRLAVEQAQDHAAVDALMRRAFGPGHFAKVSERLREGNVARGDLCFCAWSGDTLAGAVRLWPVRAGGSPLLFLGPIGVEEAFRGMGLGALLIERACGAALAAGDPLIALVGARALFEPLGFSVVPEGRLLLPGPVDPQRIFWRALRPDGEAGIAGAVVPAPDLGCAP